MSHLRVVDCITKRKCNLAVLLGARIPSSNGSQLKFYCIPAATARQLWLNVIGRKLGGVCMLQENKQNELTKCQERKYSYLFFV